MNPAAFPASLTKETAPAAARELLARRPRLYAAVIGLDGRPAARPVVFRFEEGGALCFACAKCERFYGELSQNPELALCVTDPESGLILRLNGRAHFSEEPQLMDRLFSECPDLAARYGDNRKMLTAYFLTGAEGVFEAEDPGVPPLSFSLGDPAGVLVGIRMKKDKEIRDRLAKLLARREEEGEDGLPGDARLAKLYDGALLYFAETAKELWPRMDIQPIERAARFETWDEREAFTSLAKRLIGNASVDKPEDLTYWLNPETLAALLEERG